MSDLYLNPDQIVKQEQYKDLLREAAHYRLTKATPKPRPKYLHKSAGALRQALVVLTRRLPSLGPIGRARI